MDSQIKRDLLQKLMDLMDEHTRTDMKGSISEDPNEENAETGLEEKLEDQNPSSIDNPMKDEDDDTNVIDPIVMLAKRFKK